MRYTGRNRKRGAVITVGLIFLSLVATMVGGSYFGKAGFDIFPKEKDSVELVVDITYKPGSTIESAQSQAEEVNKIINSEASGYIKEVSYQGSGSTQRSMVDLRLTDMKSRSLTSVQISEKLQTKFNELAKKEGILATASSSGAGGPSSDYPLELQIFSEDSQKAESLLNDAQIKLQGARLKTLRGKDFVIAKTLKSDDATLVERQNGQQFISLKVAFSEASSTELIEATKTYIDQNIKPEQFGLNKSDLKTDIGFEEENQKSFKSMLIAFPVLLLAMFILLAVQFKSLLQPLFIFLAIPFSFFGIGAGLYYTNNSASFFVMLGFFALIGIALNNTILITDFANQERRKGAGRVESIARALQARFRPLLTTSITSVVALIPLTVQDPFWQSLGVTLIFGLLSSTILVILCFPYYLIASEVLRAGGSKIAKKIRRRK